MNPFIILRKKRVNYLASKNPTQFDGIIDFFGRNLLTTCLQVQNNGENKCKTSTLLQPKNADIELADKRPIYQ